MTDDNESQPAISCAAWEAPKWATRHEAEDAGIRWLHPSSAEIHRLPERIGQPLEAVQIEAYTHDFISTNRDEAVVKRDDTQLSISGDQYSIHEARKLAVAILGMCEHVERS